jgi:glycosyltransferase involved in cell wall biosynthesis
MRLNNVNVVTTPGSEFKSKPLLTFALFAYQQERFIQEAIEGAFSQTYSPLEIILSDDCSSDRTFEIMRDAAANYGGPHKVVLNCNPKNVGLTEHLNRVVGLASGDLIVGAGGDDISLPERVVLSAESWELSGRQATSIHGRFVVIDETGRLTGDESRITWPSTEAVHLRQNVKPVDFVRTLRPEVQGSCHAFAKRLFTDLGPLPAYVEYEDFALAFRSALVGEIAYVDRVFVKYRRHGRNMYSPLEIDAVKTADQLSAYHQQVARECFRFVRLYDCFETDVKTLAEREKLDLQTATALGREIGKARRPFQMKLDLFDPSPIRRLQAFWNVVKAGGEVKYALGRLTPRFLYDWIFFSRIKLGRQLAR